MVEEGTSHHQQVQAITTLRSGRKVNNHMHEKDDEQIGIPQNLQKEKGKQVSIVASSSSSTPAPEISYKPRVPFPNRLKAPSHFGSKERKYKIRWKSSNR
jgi:hypothetical protein